MYLHLGQDTVVSLQEVIGIFDMDNTTVSKFTNQFLHQAQTDGRLVSVTEDLPKSFIVCQNEKNRSTVYLSQLASSTLLKRSRFVEELSGMEIRK